MPWLWASASPFTGFPRRFGRGQLDHRPHRVVRLRRDPHDVILADRAGVTPPLTSRSIALPCRSSQSTIAADRGRTPVHLNIACAGLVVGFVIGLTGMGGGALMTPDPRHLLRRHPVGRDLVRRRRVVRPEADRRRRPHPQAAPSTGRSCAGSRSARCRPRSWARTSSSNVAASGVEDDIKTILGVGAARRGGRR